MYLAIRQREANPDRRVGHIDRWISQSEPQSLDLVEKLALNSVYCILYTMSRDSLQNPGSTLYSVCRILHFT